MEVAVIDEVESAVLGRYGAEDALSREQAVEDDGQVETPVSRVVVDEDGVDFQGFVWIRRVDGRREWLGLRIFGVIEAERIRKRPDGGVGVEDVAGSNNSLEPIPV